MALIQCPECGHKVSDKAIQCVSCGYPLAQATNEKSREIVLEKDSIENTDNNIVENCIDSIAETNETAKEKEEFVFDCNSYYKIERIPEICFYKPQKVPKSIILGKIATVLFAITEIILLFIPSVQLRMHISNWYQMNSKVEWTDFVSYVAEDEFVTRTVSVYKIIPGISIGILLAIITIVAFALWKKMIATIISSAFMLLLVYVEMNNIINLFYPTYTYSYDAIFLVALLLVAISIITIIYEHRKAIRK